MADTKTKKHPQGNMKFAAEKAFARLTAKQNRNIKRGRTGHKPIIRKILK
jgi:hypothetical protein